MRFATPTARPARAEQRGRRAIQTLHFNETLRVTRYPLDVAKCSASAEARAAARLPTEERAARAGHSLRRVRSASSAHC